MNAENTNRIFVIIATGFLLFYLYLASFNSECFEPIKLLAGYSVLIYDIASQIAFLVMKR